MNNKLKLALAAVCLFRGRSFLAALMRANWDFFVGLPEGLLLAPPLRTLFSKPSGKGRTVVVTGGASGIGRATALALAKLGWSVIAADINETGLKSLEGVPNLSTFRLDVTCPESCDALVLEVSRLFPGGLSALCNIAGIAIPSPVLGQSGKMVDMVFSINTLGPIRLMRLLMPALLKGASKRNAVVLNLTSTGGIDAWPWMGAYSASKHALEGATKAARREAIANNLPVDFVCVEPGPVDTPLSARVPALGLKWCDENADSVWAPALRTSAQFGSDGMKKTGLNAASFRLGYTPEEVAEINVNALSSTRPRARYLVIRGPFLWLFTLVGLLPREAGDMIMACV